MDKPRIQYDLELELNHKHSNDIGKLIDIFSEVTLDKNKRMNMKEYNRLGLVIPFEDVDKNGDGYIDLLEFISTKIEKR